MPVSPCRLPLSNTRMATSPSDAHGSLLSGPFCRFPDARRRCRPTLMPLPPTLPRRVRAARRLWIVTSRETQLRWQLHPLTARPPLLARQRQKGAQRAVLTMPANRTRRRMARRELLWLMHVDSQCAFHGRSALPLPDFGRRKKGGGDPSRLHESQAQTVQRPNCAFKRNAKNS